MRRFEFTDARSNKFWEIDHEGDFVTTRWGRIGTDGQTKTKELASEAAAEEEADKQVQELDPGLFAGASDMNEDQTLGVAKLRKHDRKESYTALTPVQFSELCRDLEALRG